MGFLTPRSSQFSKKETRRKQFKCDACDEEVQGPTEEGSIQFPVFRLCCGNEVQAGIYLQEKEELTGQQEEECIPGRGHMCESPAAEGAGEWCKMTQKGGQRPDYTGPRRLHQSLAFIPRSFGRVLSREMIHLCLEDHSGYTVKNEMKWGKNRNTGDQFRRLSQPSR